MHTPGTRTCRVVSGIYGRPMKVMDRTRAGLAIATAVAALAATGCAKEQVSCAHFAHERGVPSTLRHALLAESRHKGGDCRVTQPK